MSEWRRRAAPIIHEAIASTTDPRERRRRLKEAYPFGERKGWPYAAWLAEIKSQWPGFTRRPVEPEELELMP